MSILATFSLGDRPEGTKLYDWLLSKFKSHNFCAKHVTYGFVSDLQGLLQVKKSRHDVVDHGTWHITFAVLPYNLRCLLF